MMLLMELAIFVLKDGQQMDVTKDVLNLEMLSLQVNLIIISTDIYTLLIMEKNC